MSEDTTTNPVEGEIAPEAEVEVETPEVELGEDGEPLEPDEPEEEVEEVERDGKKYKVPKALTKELMLHADYTRKTQEVAEQRKEVEALKAQAIQSSAEHIQSIARVVALRDAAAQYDQIDWNAWRAYDQQNGTQETTRLMIEKQQVVDAFKKAESELSTTEQQRALEAQQLSAKQLQEADAILARDIPGFTEKLPKMTQYAAKEFGFTTAEVVNVARMDPRLIKLLNRAFEADEVKTKQAAGKRVAQSAAVKPVPPVSGNAPASKDPARMSTSEWMAHRNAQAARKAGR